MITLATCTVNSRPEAPEEFRNEKEFTVVLNAIEDGNGGFEKETITIQREGEPDRTLSLYELQGTYGAVSAIMDQMDTAIERAIIGKSEKAQ